jgi:hypothetical protein
MGPPTQLLIATPTTPPTIMPTHSCLHPVASQTNVDMWQWPPRRQASTQPPPDPNLDPSIRQSVIRPGKGAITFALPPVQPQPDAVSLRCRAAIQVSAKTLYILTPAQRALSRRTHGHSNPPPTTPIFGLDTIAGMYPPGAREVPSIQLHPQCFCAADISKGGGQFHHR